MAELNEPIWLADGIFAIELNRAKGLITITDAECFRGVTLDYWQFGALIKELEGLRRQLLTIDPWADPDMFSSGRD